MGSFFETNDTLQITREQGFPAALELAKHKITPIKAEDFKDQIFEFKNKKQIRLYQQVPINNYLVENIGGQWVYWGWVHVLEIHHDYVTQMTSGKFRIIKIFTIEEMSKAFDLRDGRLEMKFNLENI